MVFVIIDKGHLIAWGRSPLGFTVLRKLKQKVEFSKSLQKLPVSRLLLKFSVLIREVTDTILDFECLDPLKSAVKCLWRSVQRPNLSACLLFTSSSFFGLQ